MNKPIEPVTRHPWFSAIRRPSRYMGQEINAVRKDPAGVEVSVALAFPDVYEVGMSHLGLKILYHLLNAEPWIAAERVFCPWLDLEKELAGRGLPLTTLEWHRPLSGFDILGFSLQHELTYTNVLTMLHLGGVPLCASERREHDPLVIAGGPACFNPEPAAAFFDLFVIGDGEHALLEICRQVREAKPGGWDRRAILRRLAGIQGVYVPAFVDIRHSADGTIMAPEASGSQVPWVEKAVIADIDAYPFPERQIVPFAELVHDRFAVEIARGCSRGCRFCQAGMIYRPVRERSPESVLEKSRRGLKATGYEDLSLLSLSTGDYGCIEPLLTSLMDRQSEEKIALSLPSLRVDTLAPHLLEQIKRVRKTGFTLAPEAGNERLRNVINKGLAQEEILDMARTLYGAGWNLIKLYFMIGLPTEVESDLQDIVELAAKIARLAGRPGRRPKLNVSLSTFVPKAHTPFMWATQISMEESRRRIWKIRQGLRRFPVKVKWNQPELSWLEGIFARGDRRLAQAILAAWQAGARFDAWGECCRIELWQETFARLGLDPAFYLHRPRPPEELFPWEHIRSRVTRDFLRREWKKALRGETTADCRRECHVCGVCDHRTLRPLLFDTFNPPEGSVRRADHRTGPLRKYRLTVSKLDEARHLSHLELARTFSRALRRAGVRIAYSQGFHPMPRISFAVAIPVGTESLAETVEIVLEENAALSSLQESINRELPAGVRVEAVEAVSMSGKRRLFGESRFHVTLKGAGFSEDLALDFLEKKTYTVEKRNGQTIRPVDARPMVRKLHVLDRDTLELVLRHTSGPSLKPSEIVQAVFQLSDAQAGEMRVLKTHQSFDPNPPGRA